VSFIHRHNDGDRNEIRPFGLHEPVWGNGLSATQRHQHGHPGAKPLVVSLFAGYSVSPDRCDAAATAAATAGATRGSNGLGTIRS
jgi:hypothetical protein